MNNLPSNRTTLCVAALVLVFVDFGAVPATAQEGNKQESIRGELRSIYEKADPVERLEAYDDLVEELFQEAEQPLPERRSSDSGASPATERWIVNVETDPLSDQTVVFFAVPASSGRSRYGDSPLLALRRSGRVESVYIIWHDYLADDKQTVEYRIDDGERQRQRWNVSTDNEATFFSGDVMSLIKELVDAERFVARTTPYNESPVTAVFDLSGLRELVEQHSEYVGDWAE
jgi:type VI secretion system protein VasI